MFISNADAIARPLRLTVDEALTLMVGLRALAANPGITERDAVLGALAKLEQATGTVGQASARVHVSLDDAAAQQVLADARRAVQQHRRVRLEYHAFGRDEVERARRRPDAGGQPRLALVPRGLVPPGPGLADLPSRPGRRGWTSSTSTGRRPSTSSRGTCAGRSSSPPSRTSRLSSTSSATPRGSSTTTRTRRSSTWGRAAPGSPCGSATRPGCAGRPGGWAGRSPWCRPGPARRVGPRRGAGGPAGVCGEPACRMADRCGCWPGWRCGSCSSAASAWYLWRCLRPAGPHRQTARGRAGRGRAAPRPGPAGGEGTAYRRARPRATPVQLAVFTGIAQAAAERRAVREALREQRRARRDANRPGWARRVDSELDLTAKGAS